MRTFTLPEAHTLLPILDSLLQRAQTSAAAATSRENALAGLTQAIFLSGGLHVDLVEVARIKAEHNAAVSDVKDSLEEIRSIGVEVHDLASGLLEFPYQLGDEIVMLCWLQGEKNITQWHAAESGWDERVPLDDRFEPGDKLQ